MVGQRYSLALLDGNPEVNTTMQREFAKQGQFNIRLYANDVDTFVKLYRKGMNFSILLLEADLPFRSGIDCLPILRKMLPDTKIILYTDIRDSLSIIQAFRRGADGYLVKDAAYANLERLLLDSMTNHTPLLSPIVAQCLIFYLQAPVIDPNDIELKDKEKWVIQLIARGKSYEEIARETGFKIDTVRYYIKKIYKKLKAHNKTTMLHHAKEMGLLEHLV